MDKTPGLEQIVARLDRNPFESMATGRTTPFYALYNLKPDTIHFDEKAWAGLTTMLGELPGPILIAGGLFEACSTSYTKNEAATLHELAHHTRGPQTIREQLEHKKNVAQERLSRLPADSEIHYFYGPRDIRTIAELYNENLTTICRSIGDACKGIAAIQQALVKTSGKVKRIDGMYAKKAEDENRRYGKQRTSGKGRKKKDDDEDADNITADELHQERLSSLQDEREEKRLEEICKGIASIAKAAETASSCIDRLASGNLETVRALTEPFTLARAYYEHIARLTSGRKENLSGLDKADPKPCDPLEVIDGYIDLLSKQLESMSKALARKGTSWTMTPKAIGTATRNEILRNAKEEYWGIITGLFSESGGPIIKVHGYIQNAVQINGAMILASGFSGGMREAVQTRNYTRIRHELFSQKTKGSWTDYIDDKDLEMMLSRADKDQDHGRAGGQAEGAVGTRATNRPDIVIAGNDQVYRWGPLDIDPDVKNERPCDVFTLAPFTSIESARESHNRQHAKSAEPKRANDGRATSGFLILDYDPKTTTRAAWIHPTMIESAVELARKAKQGTAGGTLNGINSSDDHPGQVHVRYDNLWGTSVLRIIDESITWMDMLGDAFQGHNFRGTHTEGRTKIARLDDQVRLYHMLVREGIKQVVSRSNMKHPVAYTIGNHDNPVEQDFGIDLVGLLLESINCQLEEERTGLKGLDALTPERVCINLHYKLTELGYESNLDKQPIRVYWSGHNGHGRRTYELSDGTPIGTSIICHKTLMGAGGDKMDPVHRIALYAKETGRITHDVRELKAGHIHIPMVGNICGGINVCVNPSSEAMDKRADNPFATESTFGVMVGFTVPVAGAWKSYVSTDPKGPIFYEFMHSGITRALHDHYIKPKIDQAWGTVPASIRYNLLT